MLNLVVIVDREWKGEIANRLERAGRYHASRTVLCAVEDGRDDARRGGHGQLRGAAGRTLGVMHEQVEIDSGPSICRRCRRSSIRSLVGEIPTVLWSPHGHDEAVDGAAAD